MAELGTVERAYADGYAAAQHEIERLRAALESIADFSRDVDEGVLKKIARKALNRAAAE